MPRPLALPPPPPVEAVAPTGILIAPVPAVVVPQAAPGPTGPGEEAPKLLPSSKRALHGVVASHLPQIQACYAEWSAHTPGIKRRVKLELRVTPFASQRRATLDQVTVLGGGPPGTGMEACVLRIFQDAWFEVPPLGQATSVVFPFAGGASGDEYSPDEEAPVP